MRPSLPPWLIALVFALPVCPAFAAESVACPVEGRRIHWIADYCMSKLETDDEIPAAECIDEQIRAAPADECAAKRHYKRALCALAASRNDGSGTTVSDSVEKCVADNRFMGRTVRNNGVGR